MSSRIHSLVAVTAVALASAACSTTPSRTATSHDAAAPAHALVSCPGGSVRTPEQAAAFYGCESVTGDLRIESSELFELGTFATLKEVSGALVIADNPRLRSLDGLESLSSVGTLRISSNPKLGSVSSLEALTLAGSVEVAENPALRSLAGLEGLERLERLEVRGNGIDKTTGLEGLERVGELVIRDNRRLISLAGLAHLTHARSVEVSNNPRLCAQLGLFQGLARVERGMSVTRNFGLSAADLDGLRARVRQGGAATEIALAP